MEFKIVAGRIPEKWEGREQSCGSHPGEQQRDQQRFATCFQSSDSIPDGAHESVGEVATREGEGSSQAEGRAIMSRRRFWSGFATGAAVGSIAGLGSWLLSKKLGRQEYGKILRLEKSVQVGHPIEEVFEAWADLENLPRYVRGIDSITVNGKKSHWRVTAAGRAMEWDAKQTQHIPNQALGWKSLNGPKHTGRINFARLGNDTLVHVVMNYAPPAGLLTSSVVEAYGRIEGVLEEALRDFKASLEGKGQENAQQVRSTGTYGGGASRQASPTGAPTQSSRFGGVMNAIEANQAERTGTEPATPPNPVDYTSPPEAKR